MSVFAAGLLRAFNMLSDEEIGPLKDGRGGRRVFFSYSIGRQKDIIALPKKSILHVTPGKIPRN